MHLQNALILALLGGIFLIRVLLDPLDLSEASYEVEGRNDPTNPEPQ
jgi:hypothetical protein